MSVAGRVATRSTDTQRRVVGQVTVRVVAVCVHICLDRPIDPPTPFPPLTQFSHTHTVHLPTQRHTGAGAAWTIDSSSRPPKHPTGCCLRVCVDPITGRRPMLQLHPPAPAPAAAGGSRGGSHTTSSYQRADDAADGGSGYGSSSSSTLTALDVYRLACAELQVAPKEALLAALEGEGEGEEGDGVRTVTLPGLVRGCVGG